MTPYEYYNRRLPDYYRNMHLDGYTDNEVLHALHQHMIRQYQERKKLREPDVMDIRIKSEVRIK
jgi:hypothetical protein